MLLVTHIQSLIEQSFRHIELHLNRNQLKSMEPKKLLQWTENLCCNGCSHDGGTVSFLLNVMRRIRSWLHFKCQQTKRHTHAYFIISCYSNYFVILDRILPNLFYIQWPSDNERSNHQAAGSINTSIWSNNKHVHLADDDEVEQRCTELTNFEKYSQHNAQATKNHSDKFMNTDLKGWRHLQTIY